MPISTALHRNGAIKGAVIRETTEENRASSPLEAFFDLCFVVAVAQVSTGLHETLAEHRISAALIAYSTMFFAVWWAWMNFTWFANAHDADDIPYRLLTLTQVAGALVMATGVLAVFEHNDFTTVTIGYVIMRVAQVTQWVRVARAFESMHRRAMRYAVGISVVQVLWVLHIFTHGTTGVCFGFVLVVLEIAVPVWAEQAATENATHVEHITDRYGLFTLIVLGEAVSAATLGVQQAARSGITADLVAVAGSGLLISFVAWWLYFGSPHRGGPATVRGSFEWGYGHYLIFASLGAIGAGVHLATQYVSTSARVAAAAALGATEAAPATASATVEQISTRVASLAIAVPVAVFLLAMVILSAIAGSLRRAKLGPILGGAAVILIGGLSTPVVVTAVVVAVTMVIVIACLIIVDLPAAAAARPAPEP